MTVDQLEVSLDQLGVRLISDGEKLRFEAPRGALTPDLRAAITEHKAELQARLRARASEPRVAPPRLEPSEERAAPLSYGQQRLLFMDQFLGDEARAMYNMPGRLHCAGDLDVHTLERAVQTLIRRHEILRSTFSMTGAMGCQEVHEPAAFAIPIVDLTSEAERGPALDRLAQLETFIPFDLGRGPSFRLTALRMGPREWCVLFTLHHLVADGWSLALFARELCNTYAELQRGRTAAESPSAIQYKDFARWQRKLVASGAFDKDLAYWKQQLDGAPELLPLPTSARRPPMQSFRGGVEWFRLSAEDTRELRGLARAHHSTLFATLLAGFQMLLARYAGADDIVVATPVANRRHKDLETSLGFFLNTLLIRCPIAAEDRVTDVIARVTENCLAAFDHQNFPYERLVEELNPARATSHNPLFQVMFILQNQPEIRFDVEGLEIELRETASGWSKFDLTLAFEERAGALEGKLEYASSLFDAAFARQMVQHLTNVLRGMVRETDRRVSELTLLSDVERGQVVAAWSHSELDTVEPLLLHEAFERQAALHPTTLALTFEGEQLSYAELNRRADELAVRIRQGGVRDGEIVALCIERSTWMVTAMLAILKAGCAYLPLDPEYPDARIQHLLGDSRAVALIVSRALRERFNGQLLTLCCDDGESAAPHTPWPRVEPDAAAYVMYTSGSTGEPKGVVVEHRQTAGFFVAMDRRLGASKPGVWLSTTTITFDISVLEIFWSLGRGFHVVLQRAQRFQRNAEARRKLDFGLFYFGGSSADGAREQYRLLMEGAAFADKHGFNAVWTPERHFDDFGDLYPNPSVTGAALAATTRHVQIRAGSVVLPLHDPIRVFEEWSVVDNISEGRVGLSFASGWHPNDFVLAPDRYADRQAHLRQGIATMRALWAGEPVTRQNGVGRTVQIRPRPRPVQTELPVWVTSAGSSETFVTAGKLGANVLTHLLGQSLEELEVKVSAYRAARAAAGHDAAAGRVSLMVHAFVHPDRQYLQSRAKAAFRGYLQTSAALFQRLLQASAENELDSTSDAERDRRLDRQVDRLLDSSTLVGSFDECLGRLESIALAGVDEIACLIDFGLPAQAVLDSLPALARLQQAWSADYSIAAQVRRHGVTHLQVTPSMASMLLASEREHASLSSIDTLLVGGEALSQDMADQLCAATGGRVLNVYGPTETTVWASAADVRNGEPVTLGKPLANSHLYVLDARREPVPAGVVGEIAIGGSSVARGYLHRPELTRDRFVVDPFRQNARMYLTGDLGRRRADDTVEFLGRRDSQVKVRGHRIELLEIEAAANSVPGVRQSAAAVVSGSGGQAAIALFFTRESGSSLHPDGVREGLRRRLPLYMVPDGIQELDELPQTFNGKIERKQLARLTSTLQHRERAGGISPRNEVELALVGIWEELLSVRPIGMRENFFELGGHSLLAVKMVAAIKAALGKELALQSLFQATTIEEQAKLVRDSTAPADRSGLVEIAKGEGNPLFCLPGAGGNVLYFYSFSRGLGPGIRLCGLQPLDVSTDLERVVETIAAQYVDDIRGVRPHGPYRLLGHSFGAHVALEVALRLGALGEEIEFFGVCDSPAPVNRVNTRGADWDEPRWLMIIGGVYARLYDETFSLTYEQLQALSPTDLVPTFMGEMKSKGLLPPEFTQRQFESFLQIFKADQRTCYVPSARYHGAITVFRAKEFHPDSVTKEEAALVRDNPTLGWDGCTDGPVRVVEMPGDHVTMMREPHVRALAQAVRMQIT
jgi:natural product biosynthesis luciferase-like monooxygenase protein